MLEQAIIGGLFLFPEELPTAMDILTAEDFRNHKTKAAFSSILTEDSCDPLIIEGKAGLQAGETDGWIEAAAMQSFFKRECLELKERSRVAQVKDLGRKIITGNRSFEELATEISEAIANISRGTTDTALLTSEIIGPVMKGLEERQVNKGKQCCGISTGFPDLDKITTGGHPGELWVVAGRPGMGKSAFGVNLIENAGKHGFKSLFFSTEMAHAQLVERMLSGQASVDFTRIRHGDFDRDDWARLSQAAGRIHRLPIKIDKCPGLTPQELRARIHKHKRDGLDIVVLDFLQRMDIRGENRSRAVGEVTRMLKDLALELNLWIVCLSQLNRGLENRDDKRPRMSDLRESGEIEQDADLVLFPYREAMYCQKCMEKDQGHDYLTHQAKTEFIIGKQRNGPFPYVVNALWLGEFVKFVGIARGHEDGNQC